MAGSKYYVERGGLRSGPFTSQELKSLAANGQVLFGDYIWKKGMLDSIPAHQVIGLFPAAAHNVLDEGDLDAESKPSVDDRADDEGDARD